MEFSVESVKCSGHGCAIRGQRSMGRELKECIQIL